MRAGDRGAGPVVENDRYRVEVAADGRLRVIHRPSGHAVDGAYLLVDEADAGDAYTHAPAPEARPLTSAGRPARAALVHSGPALAAVAIEHELALPAGLTADRRRRGDVCVPTRVRTEASLAAGGRWVELRTEVDNHVRDHRLRVVFPTGVAAEDVEAYGHFDRVTRPVAPASKPDWPEPPGPASHQNGYVAVSAGGLGVAVFSPELPEYVAEPGDRGVDLSLTLLRCTGWLSRPDLPTRAGPAGPALPAPGAQCPGRFSFRYAVAIYTSEEAPDLPAWAEAFQAQRPPALAFLAVEGQAVLTAVKAADDGEGLIARLSNPGDRATEVALRCAWPLAAAWLSRLDETAVAPLPLPDGQAVRLTVGARQIVTVRLLPAADGSVSAY